MKVFYIKKKTKKERKKGNMLERNEVKKREKERMNWKTQQSWEFLNSLGFSLGVPEN